MIDKTQGASNVPASYTNNVNRTESRRVEPADAARPARQIDGEATEVSLSSDALALQRALKAVQEAPDVRDDLVQAIRAKLEDGAYQVDADALAERLLSRLK